MTGTGKILTAAFILLMFIPALLPAEREAETGHENTRVEEGHHEGDGHGHETRQEKIKEHIERAGDGKNPGALLVIALLIFSYGLLHGTGVAHGNAILSGWIMAARQRYRDVLMASLLTGLFHALTATVVVMTAWFVLKQAIDTVKLGNYMRIIAGSMVLLIGAYILTTFIIAKLKGEQTCCHGHGHDVDIKGGKINPVILALGAGIVPCPITSSILIASLGFGMLWQGLVFVAVFAAGMSLSLLGISSAVWYVTGKTADVKFLRLAHIMDNVLHIAGPVIVISIGLYLLKPFIF